MMMKLKITTSIFFILLLVAYTSCKPQKKQTDKPTIIVSIEPLKFFTEAITKDNFNIVSMVPKGSSPETYDPTPTQYTLLSKSTAYFRIGYLGFEINWMEKLKENFPNLAFINTSTGIDFIYEEQTDHGDHFHQGGIEPHIWNSTKNAKIIATNILHAVLELDKNKKEEYLKNYNALIQLIDATNENILEILHTNKTKGFMIYHPTLSYFARDYGLTQISIEKDGKEPTLAHLKEIIKKSIQLNIRTIFIQPEFDKKNAEVIAAETGCQIITIDPLSYQWSKEMINVAKHLDIK